MLDPIIDGYEVLTELEENSDELEEKLKKLSSQVVPRPSGFFVLFAAC